MRTFFRTAIRPRALDVCCALTLAVGAVYCASSWQAAALARGEGPDFYQFDYAPAVMVACGRGLHNVPAGAAPALDAFLTLRTDHIACGDLPSDLPTVPHSGLQRMTLYLQWTLGKFWRATEISWAAARTLSTLWCGILAVLFYATFRLVLPAVPAWIAAAIFTLSPAHLSQVWRLRDYAKAPFMLTTVFIVALLLHPRNRTRRRQLVLAALAGAAIGLGLGFRSDLQLAAVVAVGAIAIALPGTLRDRATVIATLVLTAALLGAPAIAGLTHGSNSGHATILGWAPEFDRRLGIRAAAYDPIPTYLDSAAAVTVVGWSARMNIPLGRPDMATADYDRLTAAYLGALWRRLPADVLTRAIAAVEDRLGATLANGLQVWLPLPNRAGSIALLPPWLSRPGIGIAAAGILATALAVWRPELCAAAFWIGLLLLGGASIQYAPRHLFYLDFIAVWCVAATVAVMRRIVVERPPLRRSILRVAALAAVGAFLWAMQIGLRHWQGVAMTHEFDVLRTTPLEPFPIQAQLPAQASGSDDRRTLLAVPPKFWLTGDGHPQSALLRVEVSAAACTSAQPVIGIRYAASNPAVDFSKRYPLDLTTTSTASLVVPVYRSSVRLPSGYQTLSFAGLELTPEDAKCVVKWGRIRPPAETEPWFATTLDASPAAYQTLQTEIPFDRTAIYVPDFRPVPREALRGSLYAASWKAIDSRIVRANNTGGWDIVGVPGGFFYLLQGPPVRRSGTPIAVVRGVLRAGALTIGLVRDARWIDEVTVDELGPFAVAIPRDGEAALVIASGVGGPGGRLDATLADAGWAVGRQATEWASPSDARAPGSVDGDASGLRPLSSDAATTSGTLRIDGIGQGKYSYVAQTDPAPRRAGEIVVVRGEIESGGLTVGLQSAGTWVASLNIEEAGPFVATLRVPRDAMYALIVARDSRDAGDRVRGRIDAVSWPASIDSTTVTR